MNVLKFSKWMNFLHIHSYIKKTSFPIVLLKRFRRKIIGFDISFDKNPKTIQKIIDSHRKENNIILMVIYDILI